jgi:RNA polymerase sigma-70 factor (ECF subfamily)
MYTTPRSLLERLRQPASAAESEDPRRAQAVAWSEFVELFAPLLQHWAGRLGLSTHDAADLVQDVFVVLVKKLPEFQHDGRHSFRAWLRTILLNQWRDKRRRAIHVTGPVDADEVAVPDPVTEIEEDEYRRHLARQALRLMQRDFQPDTWKACWETKVNSRPAAEVAAELGMSVAAVHAATSRVLRRLRQELAGFLD